jgi:uncharacterized protein YjbI with pentapeptide repeats
MADQEHLNILKQGVSVWNQWRQEHPGIRPILSDVNLTDLSKRNLSNANLSNADLSRTTLAFTDLSRANLSGADVLESTILRANFNGTNLDGTCFSFSNLKEASFTNAIHINRVIINGANLSKADLSKCNLSGANFSDCNLSEAHLFETNLIGTSLIRTNLSKADLRGAKLNGANLSWSNLSEANLSEADLTGCNIYAISAWNVQLQNTTQTGLVITRSSESIITVDNLEVAQFIYLLLNNAKIRNIIDTITSKVVLILGRFTPKQKIVLDAMRDELRKWNYSPVLFDFEKPASRDLTETVSILAHLARFIIVDLTDPSSAPHEVATIIPQCIVPVQPLLLRDDAQPRHEYAMFHDLRARYHWVLPTYQYQDTSSLLATLKEHIIEPAERKAKELAQR